jgi:hypothetical protein
MPVGQPAAPADLGKRASQARQPSLSSANKIAAITEAREEGLQGIAQIATAILILTKNYPDAGAVDMHAEPISHEIALLASENEKIGSIVDRITALGPYAGLLTAVMPLAMQILVNHDRIQADAAGLFGGKVMSKDALAAKVKADIDTAKAKFLNQARQAQEAATKAADDLAKAAA